MTTDQVHVRELVAWGLDESRYRPRNQAIQQRIDAARKALAPSRNPFQSPLVHAAYPTVMEVLERQLERADLHAEMEGLDWQLGIVDLRQLVAFQRRLVFDDALPHLQIPPPENWAALIDLCFGAPIPITYRTVSSEGANLLLQSANPGLRSHSSADCNSHPIQLHGGSPFFEVAEFNGRWFLRDGYHRAYRLLRGGVTRVPSVIIRARTLAELGPVNPWFFSADALFASRPPLVTDFLDDSLTIEYNRPRLFKTIRITVEESVEQALFPDNAGE